MSTTSDASGHAEDRQSPAIGDAPAAAVTDPAVTDPTAAAAPAAPAAAAAADPATSANPGGGAALAGSGALRTGPVSGLRRHRHTILRMDWPASPVMAQVFFEYNLNVDRVRDEVGGDRFIIWDIEPADARPTCVQAPLPVEFKTDASDWVIVANRDAPRDQRNVWAHERFPVTLCLDQAFGPIICAPRAALGADVFIASRHYNSSVTAPFFIVFAMTIDWTEPVTVCHSRPTRIDMYQVRRELGGDTIFVWDVAPEDVRESSFISTTPAAFHRDPYVMIVNYMAPSSQRNAAVHKYFKKTAWLRDANGPVIVAPRSMVSGEVLEAAKLSEPMAAPAPELESKTAVTREFALARALELREQLRRLSDNLQKTQEAAVNMMISSPSSAREFGLTRELELRRQIQRVGAAVDKMEEATVVMMAAHPSFPSRKRHAAVVAEATTRAQLQAGKRGPRKAAKRRAMQ